MKIYLHIILKNGMKINIVKHVPKLRLIEIFTKKKKKNSIHHVMDNYRATLIYIKLFIKENYYDDEDDAVHIMFIYSFDLLLL